MAAECMAGSNTDGKIMIGDVCSETTAVAAVKGSRKIEFHLARKTFTGIIGKGDFRLETLNPSVNSNGFENAAANEVPSSSGKKTDGSGFVESGLDPELTFGITIRRIGAGLENLGNTCFLNSVLQCLTYTEPLAAYLQSGKHQVSCRIAGFCALCAIQKHVSRALQSTGRILAPKDLVSNLRSISRNFRNSRQEDAHEYMVNLLESMHKCCIPKGVPSQSTSAYEKSLVHKIFGGRLRSQVKCMQCSYCSNTFDPFLDLSLEIAKADSLHKALLNFTAAEQLDGGERQYQCQHCKQKVKALKQLTVYKAPYVLTIHLKRFCAHEPGRKIDKKVQFGPSLNLKPFVSGFYEGDLKYILYGVLVHAGYSTHSGHYFSFVRTASGTWYSVDDNRVVAVGERNVLEQKAYMLFYYRERTNVGPRKPVYALQKENVAAMGLRNEMLSASNQGMTSAVQDISFKKIFGCADTFAAVKRDELNVSSTKDTQLKDKSLVQKPKMPTLVEMPETMEGKKGTTLGLTTTPCVLEHHVKGVSVAKHKADKRDSVQLPLIVSPVKDSGEISVLGNSSSASTAVKYNDRKGECSLSKDLSVSITTHSNTTTLQKPAGVTSTDMTFKKINTISNNGVSSESQSRDIYKTSGKVDTAPQNQQKNEKSQVGDVAVGTAAAVLPDAIAADTGLKSSVNGLMVSSSSPILLNGPLHMIAPDQKCHQKVKKRVMKFQHVSMNLGSNILYGTSLKSLRKKRKTKQRKKRSLHINNPNEEQVEIDMKPSTSEKTRATFPASIHPRKKEVKSCSDKHDSNMNVPNSVGKQLVDMDIINGELRERIDQHGAVQTADKYTNKRPRSNSCLEGNKCNSREPGDSKYSNRESMQNGLMNMLTRGLEETIVASWDGVDLPVSRGVESSPPEPVSIGYVPDEWDEEYDRGKKKKIRTSTNNFDGQNPFQEIASKKTQLKKAKMDRSRTGNQPFRI